jgi:hypothetical protein
MVGNARFRIDPSSCTTTKPRLVAAVIIPIRFSIAHTSPRSRAFPSMKDMIQTRY